MILVFQSSFSIDLNSRKVEFYKSAQDMMMICPILTKKINQKNFIKKKRKKIFSSKELIELKLNKKVKLIFYLDVFPFQKQNSTSKTLQLQL